MGSPGENLIFTPYSYQTLTTTTPPPRYHSLLSLLHHSAHNLSAVTTSAPGLYNYIQLRVHHHHNSTVMESQDYEHYRNLTLMFFLEKLVDKGGKFLLADLHWQSWARDNYLSRQRSRASVTRKNSKYIKALVSKWSCCNEYRHSHIVT